MESRIYTAQEMREMANREKFKCSFVTRTLNGGIILDCTSDVCAMLRQAADALEREEKREKKYEYAEKYSEGYVSCIHEQSMLIHCNFGVAVRREVGEWEEVKDGE